jgi:lipoate-protein ligase A
MRPLRHLGRRSILPPPHSRFTTPLIPSRQFSESAAANPSNKTQIYVSRSHDPLTNLSLEHRLLQTSHPDSTVLLLYTNRPCVVVGRNQNPWLEVNQARLGAQSHIQLVRRRSGGGTVFHDEGNVNFSVICPPKAFHRDTHAEMVVRALAALGEGRARVNERHDIVVDRDEGRTFKVSGSAYKLTRLRSLHHGTCLLRSPGLARISGLLRSPGEAFIKAQGVDSVRSPVANVGVEPAAFVDAVVAEFRSMYGGQAVEVDEFGEEVLEVEKVREGYEEMRERAWVYGQTPRFVLSTEATEDDPRERPAVPFEVSLGFTLMVQGI